MAFLTLAVAVQLAAKNIAAVRARRVPIRLFALYKGELPDDLLQVRDHYKNLFELPILFYTLILALLFRGGANRIDLALAWGFVFSRFIHTAIRATSNRVSIRFYAFALGFLILAVHWSYFLLRLGGSA